MHFQSNEVAASADHFRARNRGHVIAADQGSGMFRVEGVFDADRNIAQFHVFGGFGVNRFHIHVRQLVGNVEIGVADDFDLVHAYQFRVARGKMEFLVNDAFARLGQNRQPAERDFTVSAVKMTHDAFIIFDIAGNDRHFRGEIHILECVQNRLIQRLHFHGHPAGEINETGIDAVCLQNQSGVECAVRFAHRRQKFAGRGQIIRRFGVSRRAQIHDVFQTGFDAVEPVVHKIIGFFHIQSDVGERFVVCQHFFPDSFQRVFPFLAVVQNVSVNTRRTGFFVFEQGIGNAGICGNHERAVVKFRAFALADNDIVHDLAETAHRGPADFFNGMLSHDFRYPQFGLI